MTLTIEIAPEKEVRLENEARRNGMSIDEYAKILIEKQLDSFLSPNDFPAPVQPKIVGKAEMRDFTGDDAWLKENAAAYIGQYIALHGNLLIAHGASFKEVAGAAREAGYKDAFITFVEDPDSPLFVGL